MQGKTQFSKMVFFNVARLAQKIKYSTVGAIVLYINTHIKI